MLEPREADIPLLFLFLVVLPLVTYVLLGKWSEGVKKRKRISLLAHIASDEAFRVEAVATSNTISVVSSVKDGIHVCARCCSPATTRCSRCKSVRYCSGRCQIIHWRQVHKQECQQLEIASSCSSPKAALIEDTALERISANNNSLSYGYKKHDMMHNALSDNTVDLSMSNGPYLAANCAAVDISQEAMPQRITNKWVSLKCNREVQRRHDSSMLDSPEEPSGNRPINLTSSGTMCQVYANNEDNASTTQEANTRSRHHGEMFEWRCKYRPSSSLHSGQNGNIAYEIEGDLSWSGGNLHDEECSFNDETVTIVSKARLKENSTMHPSFNQISKLSKSSVKVSEEQSCSDIERRGLADDSRAARKRGTSESNGVASTGIMKMIGLRKSKKLAGNDATELSGIHKKLRMLFPYEEFLKIFNCEVMSLLPRGLLNCGNSCYANAVLQCLTFTKPLINFLLRRSHSRACCEKDWCLMCELEQHVMMLRECGGPLSPSRILFHIRKINCLIGDGSQEDAHEFLRLLVASMQSICLAGLGGEDKVDPQLQETTFIQHTFGGLLRSKVICLKCHHESERYENFMDLTLEIFGWVESLEDALTQFTTPEELDGENMYRCGRCTKYVRARKQLSIHEAPNILTVVLKRFQEGKYGKINKCITFPEMLDMIPFMTGTSDIPPLYMLYAVVVHLDTFNASFSGHYVAYVKDLQGTWFKIDDTEVHPVPLSQVMSESVYILFYMRSFPRPERACYEKAMQHQVAVSARTCTSRTQRPSRLGQSRLSYHFVAPEPSLGLKLQNVAGLANHSNGTVRRTANRNISQMMEFPDATSSDWSLFTSSDEASFTTESTRDSFSTVDYADTCGVDTFSSIFNNLYARETSFQKALFCRKISNSRPQTGFFSEERSYVLDSYLPIQPPDNENFVQVSNSSTELPADGNCILSVKYGSNPKCSLDRTSCHCKL